MNECLSAYSQSGYDYLVLLSAALLVGGEGFQLFVDEGVAVDSDLIARLVKEVVLQIAVATLREVKTERSKEAPSSEDCIHYSDTFEDLTSSSGLQTPIVPTPELTPPSSLPMEEDSPPTADSAALDGTVVATPSPSPPPSPVHSRKEEEPVGPKIDTPEVTGNHSSSHDFQCIDIKKWQMTSWPTLLSLSQAFYHS